MLQIRLSLPEFSNGVNFSDPIIMEGADSITLTKGVNSSDEGITFTIGLTDPKIQYVNYLRWWECWDTETNSRVNYGPIRQISRASGESKKVQGPGRSALLEDYIKSVQTFYYPINIFLDDLRYENLSAQPRTSTIINKNTASEYYGLSMRSKDNAIDEQTGYIAIGRDTPVKSQKKTDSFWAGVGKSDYLVVDLGEEFYLSKARILLPWWMGSTINNSRSYDWSFEHSNDNAGYTSVFTTGTNNHSVTSPVLGGKTLYFGEDGYEIDQNTVAAASILARYWKVNIANTHAYYGVNYDGISSDKSDEWDWECAGTNIFFGASKDSPFLGEGGVISRTELTPPNDCYASVVELAFYKKILNKDTITNLSYKQIQNDSRQITYYHVPDSSEMLSAGGGVKFEPGTFFRNITYTGSATVKDEFNTVLSTAQGTIRAPAYTRVLVFSNPASQVTFADTWPGKLDAFSYGGSYSYTTVANDTAILHFRGTSVKWYITVPAAVTAGQVSIELRELDNDGLWSAWTTLESSLTLPTDVAAHLAWEITVESGLLEIDTTYQLKITNLNGGYVSIDGFAGYWSASFTEINEDDARLYQRFPQYTKQIYDQKFSGGSAYELQDGGTLTRQGLAFEGDRIIVYARKGPDFGEIWLALSKAGEGLLNIPGSNADKSYRVDLNSPFEISQCVIFDTDELFDDPALSWGNYNLAIYKPTDDTDSIWVDGFGMHETTGLSVKFLDTTYLDILTSTAEALQMEWDVTEAGIKVVPRIGADTEVIFAEGRGTTIKVEDVEDVGEVATMLVSSGADIDGLPLSAVVENKNNKRLINRTIQRLYDLRNVGDYYTLIGAARTELLRRGEPQRRITVTTTNLQGISHGDSFIVHRPDLTLRVRAMQINRTQSSNAGTQYVIECLKWPQII